MARFLETIIRVKKVCDDTAVPAVSPQTPGLSNFLVIPTLRYLRGQARPLLALNERGETTRKGGKFLQQFIQRLLTNGIYVGRYHFNKKDKNGISKPEDDWVFLKTPRIVGDEIFHAANERLRRNTAFSTPPRVINGQTLLTGIAHRKSCGSPPEKVSNTVITNVDYGLMRDVQPVQVIRFPCRN